LGGESEMLFGYDAAGDAGSEHAEHDTVEGGGGELVRGGFGNAVVVSRLVAEG
jgi:hypothetical protein